MFAFLSQAQLAPTACKTLCRQFASANTAAAGKNQLQVFLSTTHDPFLNLATEDWIFREGDLSKRTLFLWRNAPTIVIGRNQNPYKECRLQDMEQQGVILTRRQSGGGAVYHDLGNTNFTFLSSFQHYDKSHNTEIIVRALARFGVKAEASGRNDILVGGKKIVASCVCLHPLPYISGSAYKLAPPRAFHHGTLLINVDLGALGRLLNPNKEKLKSKGVQSVQARVMNLQEAEKSITHDTLSQAIIQEFFKFYDAECPVEPLIAEDLKKLAAVKKSYEQLQDWAWRFGETPEFEHLLETRFDWGTLDLHVNSADGLITNVKIFSDCLYPSLVDSMTHAFTGKRYDRFGVMEAIMEANRLMRAHADELPIEQSRAYLRDVESWLVKSL